MIKQNFKVEGMSCNHCVERVEKAIGELEGVKKVKVNLKKADATVKYDETTLTAEDIINKVVAAGYEAKVS